MGEWVPSKFEMQYSLSSIPESICSTYTNTVSFSYSMWRLTSET